MIKIESTLILLFLFIVLDVAKYVDSSNILNVDFDTTNIANKNSTDSLDTLIQTNLNCTETSECQSKSRRKRYVAFPEGSSFSVKRNNSIEI